MILIWAIAGFFGFTTVVFAWLCARAPYGEEIPGVGFRLTPEGEDPMQRAFGDVCAPPNSERQSARHGAGWGHGERSRHGLRLVHSNSSRDGEQ